MICFQTRDDWTTIEIGVDDGLGVQTWTPASDVRDAYSASLDLISWMLSTFGDTTTAAYATAGDAAQIILTASASYDWTPNAAADAILGTSGAVGGASEIEWLSPSGAAVAPSPSGTVAISLRYEAEATPPPRAVASVGAVAIDCGGQSAEASRALLALTPPQLAHFRAAVAAARNPRVAAILRARDSTWIEVGVARIDIARRMPATRVRVEIEVWS